MIFAVGGKIPFKCLFLLTGVNPLENLKISTISALRELKDFNNTIIDDWQRLLKAFKFKKCQFFLKLSLALASRPLENLNSSTISALRPHQQSNMSGFTDLWTHYFVWVAITLHSQKFNPS